MPTSEAINASLQELIDTNNDFGFRLLAWLVEQDAGKNVFVSSFSVAVALAMTYNGTEGKTKEDLAELLGLTGLSLQQVNEANAGLMSMQDTLDAKVQLAIANSIWVRLGMTLSPDFAQRIKGYYTGEAINLDFTRADAADIINQWVENKTHEKIKDLVTLADVSPAILILINAIYFKGIWANQFDKEKTVERDFHTLDGNLKPCLMMSQSGTYPYYETAEFQAVSLPYGAGRISMYVFLPKPAYSIGDFQKALTAVNWQKWMSKFHSAEGAIILPRFRIEYGKDLVKGLKVLGGDMVAGPDFTGMGAGPLIISKVIHKTFIEVNEEGTEAAAATAIVMTRGLAPAPFSMVIDRPFFAAIRDNTTGALLFTGFIVDPT
jgi:serine protease inhibitor